ncbi:alpha-mannosidase [Paenibacillus sp. 598K]|uniref:alpha-mannosidase n=1 Tax=Paenibacillus sp. 598K TaxID=1117987 RepID=UPI000FFA9AA7|nr:glycoside hydrolase family 38 C-terminal domain-containing protein [Paenibacillus sp. 598K]GBF74423.1 alpha-mannosidase [Paenibacillus sp. 598K]
MPKKQIHLISHSHWDREWYMPFERFRMRLVRLLDEVIALLEADAGFKSFHLDGHVLLIDDYLEIRPEKEPIIRKLVSEGKLVLGPWYVLQDAFLTSGEAQVRNMQLGLQRAEELGGAAMIGYYPDTFGNISQSAQLLQGFGIKSAIFGRGIQAINENNNIKNQADPQDVHSEMRWASPDGSSILGIFLANWYHNAMELPVDPESARQRAEVIAHNTERYALTRHLLWLNGCDHQPVQKNVAEAIAVLNQVMGADYEARHSSFPEYIAAVEAELQDCRTVTGELTGERTNGWGSLVNTASSRMILKRWNARLQRELERWSEPFSTMAADFGAGYPGAFIGQAWKYVLQNHPHDSICGCSIDEVHDEMITRFKKADQIASSVTDEALRSIASKIDGHGAWKQLTIDSEGAVYSIVIFNACDRPQTDKVTTILETEETDWDRYTLFNAEGERVACQIEDHGVVHGFTLPDDRFRVRWTKRRYTVTFLASDVPGIGHALYYMARIPEQRLVQATASGACYDPAAATWKMENERLRLTVQEDGCLSLQDLRSGEIYRDLMILEDTGDIGNEYEYRQAEGSAPRLSLGTAVLVEDASDGIEPRLRMVHEMELPAQREGSGRSVGTEKHRIALTLSLKPDRIDVEAAWVNQSKDHRLRILFPSDIRTDVVYADSPFDVVERRIEPWEGWENPSRCERMQSFFALQHGSRGLMVAADGLPEYEVLRDERRTMALTVLRCVGEMGDWNYFPTPGAQCLGEQYARFSIIPFSGSHTTAIVEAQRFLLPLRSVFGELPSGKLPASQAWLTHDGEDSVVLTSLKLNEGTQEAVLRYVNLSQAEARAVFRGTLFQHVQGVRDADLREIPLGYEAIANDEMRASVPAKKIMTKMIPLSLQD